jgi:hypothetical protein
MRHTDVDGTFDDVGAANSGVDNLGASLCGSSFGIINALQARPAYGETLWLSKRDTASQN